MPGVSHAMKAMDGRMQVLGSPVKSSAMTLGPWLGLVARRLMPARHIGIEVVFGTALLLGTLICGSAARLAKRETDRAARCRDETAELSICCHQCD